MPSTNRIQSTFIEHPTHHSRIYILSKSPWNIHEDRPNLGPLKNINKFKVIEMNTQHVLQT